MEGVTVETDFLCDGATIPPGTAGLFLILPEPFPAAGVGVGAAGTGGQVRAPDPHPQPGPQPLPNCVAWALVTHGHHWRAPPVSASCESGKFAWPFPGGLGTRHSPAHRPGESGQQGCLVLSGPRP